MKKSVIYIVIAGVVLSALLGSFKAQTEIQSTRAPQDNWDSLQNTQTRAPNYSMTAINVKASGILPLTNSQIRAIDNSGTPQTQNTPTASPFPEIKSVFNTDGTLHVMLMLADNSLVAAKTGDTIETGWTIKSIDLTNVIAVFDEKEHEFAVINYGRGQEGADK
mgnify:CR=1 FL=1